MGVSVPKVNLEIPHALPPAEVKDRLQRLAESAEAQYGTQVKDLSQGWDENVLNFGFKTFGMRFEGSIGVEENRVLVSCDLPFSAMMFKGKIESQLKEQLERRLRA